MNINISQDKLTDFTREPLLAIVTTVNPDGSPQATPVWYDYDGKYFWFTSHSGRVKVCNIRLNPKVSLVVVDTSCYGTPMIVNGIAEIIEAGAQEATEKVAIRYEGEEQGRTSAQKLADYARRIRQRRVIVRIIPDRVLYDD